MIKSTTQSTRGVSELNNPLTTVFTSRPRMCRSIESSVEYAEKLKKGEKRSNHIKWALSPLLTSLSRKVIDMYWMASRFNYLFKYVSPTQYRNRMPINHKIRNLRCPLVQTQVRCWKLVISVIPLILRLLIKQSSRLILQWPNFFHLFVALAVASRIVPVGLAFSKIQQKCSNHIYFAICQTSCEVI